MGWVTEKIIDPALRKAGMVLWHAGYAAPIIFAFSAAATLREEFTPHLPTMKEYLEWLIKEINTL